MRKKKEAQLFLERVEMIDSILSNKLVEQRQWRDIALGITANMDGERVQSSGSKSKMADAINKVIDIEAEIDNLVDELIDTKREVIAVLELLSNPTEYRLLHARYIQYVALKDIAEKWDKDYTTITTTHGRAIAHVQEILDRKEGVR